MKEFNRLGELFLEYGPITFVLGCVIGMLMGCTTTYTIADSERSCSYQTRTEVDADTIERLSAIVINATGQVMVPQRAPVKAPQGAPCETRICMSLDANGCHVQVNER